jgi:hypothetical protein
METFCQGDVLCGNVLHVRPLIDIAKLRDSAESLFKTLHLFNTVVRILKAIGSGSGYLLMRIRIRITSVGNYKPL